VSRTVDGVRNAVDEVDVRRVPVGPENQYGNPFGVRATQISSEADGCRVADGSLGRTWRIENPERANRLGRPIAYVLAPAGATDSAGRRDLIHRRRAAFATRHLWVTRYSPDEAFPGWRVPNQPPGGRWPAGLDGGGPRPRR
jgi:primary-amine oxidase